MNIPENIIEAIELLPFADRGQAFAAIITYMREEIDPIPGSLSDTAQAAFILAKAILIPILRRRKRYAARKAAKQSPVKHIEAKKKVVCPVSIDIENNQDRSVGSVENIQYNNAFLSRQERRRLEREAAKKARRAAS